MPPTEVSTDDNQIDRTLRRGLKAELLRGGVSGFFVRAGSTLAGLVASVTLARVLGPENYGAYALVFALITLLGVPVKMGLPTLVIRETARADQSADGALMRGIWRWSNSAIALMATVVLGLSGLYLWLIPGDDARYRDALVWALPLVPLLGWSEARGAAIRGLRRIALGIAPDKVGRPLLLSGVVAVVAWHTGRPLGVAEVYAIHAFIAVITLALAYVILRLIQPSHPGSESPRSKPRAWIAAIIPLSAIAGLQVVNHNTDILMLGVFTSDAEVGLYRVALSGANIALFGLTTVNLVLQPYFARAWAAEDNQNLQFLATTGARVSLATAVLFTVVYWFGGTWLLGLLFGDVYADAYWALIILCLGQCVSAFFGSIGNLLTMSGREWIALSGLICSTLINIGLNWLLIPRYGIEGAAVSTGMSIIAWNLGLWIAARKTMGVDSSPLGLHPKLNID